MFKTLSLSQGVLAFDTWDNLSANAEIDLRAIKATFVITRLNAVITKWRGCAFKGVLAGNRGEEIQTTMRHFDQNLK
ncbi:hypothetical protein [Litoreibacter meonggei]|uniref:hypothetical protein n=1 Tax=Litoreibacter meonggei TaxID=1049199 RepID=UPI000EB2E948|nr:hypothetical protein [Litoreibacter meonggei]